MTPVLYLSPPSPSLPHSSSSPESTRYPLSESNRPQNVTQSWSLLQPRLKCHGRFSCLFSDNRRKEDNMEIFGRLRK
ncbi:hypothetical protein PanWU01x14_355960 [Parasponia andersonii]|uniref:Uncharacterized protein n=1 Tax=Parasponia andersonii TaxID=3476 RepID=A0A2P5A939_PARAD|nr:hypothetical protein PanWU01x14_355960 [Parasponia andersonii]